MNNFIITNSDKYTKFFTPDFLMGPNCIRILDELLTAYPLTFSRENKILDLGCGKGITSLFIANETGATIYANDFWVTAEENISRFNEWDMNGILIPSYEDANCLSFELEIFDAIISIDAYHYFAGKEDFFAEKILPFVKCGGYVLIAIPGIKEEFEGQQEVLLKDWLGDESSLFHSCAWWKNIIGTKDKIEFVNVWELSNTELAWTEWLKQEHSFVKADSVHYESIIRKFTTFIGIAVKKKRLKN
ncbi:MAG: methyltransferase domain-containing protein [Ruminococcus sp.]|nr:methyltransferase domain-containing protein [Ruminococcus sp.]